jgi:hypothetical protein
LFFKLALNTINPNPTTEMNRKINFSKVNLEVFLLYPMELRFVEVEGNVIIQLYHGGQLAETTMTL